MRLYVNHDAAALIAVQPIPTTCHAPLFWRNGQTSLSEAPTQAVEPESLVILVHEDQDHDMTFRNG